VRSGVRGLSGVLLAIRARNCCRNRPTTCSTRSIMTNTSITMMLSPVTTARTATASMCRSPQRSPNRTIGTRPAYPRRNCNQRSQHAVGPRRHSLHRGVYRASPPQRMAKTSRRSRGRDGLPGAPHLAGRDPVLPRDRDRVHVIGPLRGRRPRTARTCSRTDAPAVG
jgi:hypothetical protein